MKYSVFIVLSALLILPPAGMLQAMGGRLKDVPMKVSKINAVDGEYLRMGTYVNGEKTQESYIVTRIDNINKKAEIYWQSLDINANPRQILPVHYTNFNTYRFTFDLKSGSLLYSRFHAVLTNKNGLVDSTFSLNAERNEVQSVCEFLDGSELKISRYKIGIRKGYPVCEMNSMLFGNRFLDITGAGIAYLCQPDALKEPIPFSLVFLGRENVKTPAGNFRTVKVSSGIADPFLGKLLQPYIKDMIFWIEDSPRMLFVKGAFSSRWEFLLEEVSTIREKDME